MPKFIFKLEAVLRHRRVIEQEKQRDHALTLARLKNLQDQLNAVNQSMQDTNEDARRNHLTGKLDLGFITAHRRFLLGMQRKGMEILAQMAIAQREVEATRAALTEAAKQRKILEKLKEKQQLRWKEENDRKETMALDEVAMQLTNDRRFNDEGDLE